jgi:Zn-dependent peptidase ImmA (M78 family)/transcriptional regulator with XRE-family HTH domain
VSVRVSVQPALLAWARERSGVPLDEVASKFPALDDWESGRRQPTLKQLEKFANSMHAPIGYFFLSVPPEESLPVPDFRTMGDEPVGHASPDLLETVYLCQQRQDWYRDYARVNREPPVAFVGSFSVAGDVVEAAARMSDILGFSPSNRGTNWSQALSHLIDAADRFGVLVMVSGIVGSNTHRKLEPREFRGFALSDELAPVIFINGADTKAAQIFTLAHELVHIGLGDSGVDDVDLSVQADNVTERWCNEVAAEFLVPAELLRDVQVDGNNPTDQLLLLARKFKVSTLVVLRRLFDAGLLTFGEFRAAYAQELERVLAIIDARPGGGGNFYNTQPLRVSKRFARAIIESTQEGQTLHRDAFKMLGFKQVSTFNEMAAYLGAGDALPT